jgi:hypothetical protein
MSDSIPSLRAVPIVPKNREAAMDDFDERREQEDVLGELVALNTATLAIDFKESPHEARHLVEAALGSRARFEPRIVEDHLIAASMAKIVGQDIPFDPEAVREAEAEAWERKVTKTIVRAWIEWAKGRPEVALVELPLLRMRQHEEERIGVKSGAVNLMALYLWAGAVEALARGENVEATRLWKRALDVACSFGADASLLVQWTYAASFFPMN